MKKIQVGQKIWLKPTARRSTAPIEVEITKIGRKYFEVEPGRYGRFYINTLTQDGGEYISNYQGYLSLEDIERDQRAAKLMYLIRQRIAPFGGSCLTHEQIESISKILDLEV
jgi:hypothetical protein